MTQPKEFFITASGSYTLIDPLLTDENAKGRIAVIYDEVNEPYVIYFVDHVTGEALDGLQYALYERQKIEGDFPPYYHLHRLSNVGLEQSRFRLGIHLFDKIEESVIANGNIAGYVKELDAPHNKPQALSRSVPFV